MQIHNLNNFSGSLGPSTYFAIDNGTDTTKISATDLLTNESGRNWVNVASLVNGLDSSNIANAIDQALGLGSYIYIPAGDYSFSATITKDCTVLLDDDCYIRPLGNETPALTFYGCSGHLIGGNACYGTGPDDTTRLSAGMGIIRFEDGYNCSVEGLTVPYSRYKVVVHVRNVDGFILENSSFKHMLRAACFIDGNCKSVTVRNCYFEDSDTADVMVDGELVHQDFCYFVYTGFFGDNYEAPTTRPVDGLIYENNYCIDSEDCCLDTHGACNVIIRNNTILDTVNAITAYNDNARMGRPNGWKMRNILIENNYCESYRTIREGSAYPHPYLFIGASNAWREGQTKPSWYGTTDYATFDDYVNCIVRNNFFGTSNNYKNSGAGEPYQPIYFDNLSRNLVFENNLIDFHGNYDRVTAVMRSINYRIRDNKVTNGALRFLFAIANGEVGNNIGCKYDYSETRLSYIKGANGNYARLLTTPTVDCGDIYYSAGLRVSKSVGINPRIPINVADDAPASTHGYREAISTFSIEIAPGGIGTVDNNVYIPGLHLSLTNESTSTPIPAYIKDVIDLRHFYIERSDGSAIVTDSPVTFTATLVAAETALL